MRLIPALVLLSMTQMQIVIFIDVSDQMQKLIHIPLGIGAPNPGIGAPEYIINTRHRFYLCINTRI